MKKAMNSNVYILLLIIITLLQINSLNSTTWINETFTTANIAICNRLNCSIEYNETTIKLTTSNNNISIRYDYSYSNDNFYYINQIQVEILNISNLKSENKSLIELIWPVVVPKLSSRNHIIKCNIKVTSSGQLLTEYVINDLNVFETKKKLNKRSISSHHQQVKFIRNQFIFKTQWPSSSSDSIGKLMLNKDLDNSFNLNISMRATRDISSKDLFYLDTKTLEIHFNQPSTKKKIYGTHYFRVFIYDHYYYTASCSLKIQVLDSNQTNRPPIFQNLIYEAQIVENNAPDTLVLQVEAIDLDLGDNGRLTYHLMDETAAKIALPFQIKSATGEIYAKKMLNREQKDLYKLTVMAIDNGLQRLSSQTQVIIRVLPQADDSPRFTQKEFNISLPDTADYWLRPTVLKVAAMDVDNQTNNLIYSLSGSLNDMNTFEIDSQTGCIRLVSKLNSELKNQYKLNIIAKDLSQPARAVYAPLTIFVEDVHVNPAVFSAPFYEFILFENVPVGQLVGRVQAIDKRKRSFDSLTFYSIQQSDLSNSEKFPFSINESSGTIQTSKKIYKNFKQGYEFNVIASIASNNNNKLIQRSNSTVRVKIKILDINDQVPQFSKSSYSINITEDSTTIGLPLLILTTKTNNRDPNLQLDYSIDSGNENEMFSLVKQDNERAFLTLERSNLNYKKQSVYELNVKVMDQDGLYSMAQVQIVIMPKDVNMPRFSQDIYTFQINENSAINTLVGTIQASNLFTDTSYNRIVYKLIQQNNNNNEIINYANDLTFQQQEQQQDFFKLDELTGNFYVSNQLDREKFESITLYVTATNYNDKTQLTDHAIVQIQLVDVNDNAPVFTRSFYELNIYKNTKLNSYLTRIEASDKDLGLNGMVRYSFDTSTNDLPVNIDSNTGIIRLNQNEDEVISTFFNLTIIASDLGIDETSLNSSTYLLINFIDEMALPPVFDVNVFVFNLYENQPVGTVIGSMQARDPDSGQEANIVYKLLTQDNNHDLFELKPSGQFNTVLLVNKFVGDLQAKNSRSIFEFSIRAHSSTTNLHTDCLIRVFLKDSNDNSPIVPKSFKIIFNNYKNYFLTEKSAYVPVHDPDMVSNLTFRLLDSIGKQVVDLDSKTGKITFKPILNSNNQINVSFLIGINDGNREVLSTCELLVLMLSDNLIAESVIISLPNLDTNIFLNYLYDKLVASLLKIIPKSSQSNIHIFNLVNSSFGLNVSLSVSYDNEKDLFMPANIVKQMISLNSELIESDLEINKLLIYEDSSCDIEPCLNYQKCMNSIKFRNAMPDYLPSAYIQFRAISVGHDFKCECPNGFTGTNSSIMCDLEINLCYSNPCGNNGECVSLESSFMCLCDVDYTGRLCEFNLKKMKCCENNDFNPVMVSSSSNILHQTTNNRKNSNNFTHNNNNLKCAATAAFTTSTTFDSSVICKGTSKCKNLILGGILCDKCEDKLNYNEFCELRTKHFPLGKHAYLALPGIQNRFRFKLKLTFATVNPNGYLFYNGRLNNHNKAGNNNMIKDFVSLQIVNSHLVFAYSLGGTFVNELHLDEINVNDGRWRSVTVSYDNQNVTISLDNDDLFETDACDFAYNNNNNNNKTESDCIRKNSMFKLPEKCFNQIETCFRYFNLNGPLKLGQANNNKKNEENNQFEGCISDVYLNDKLIDLNRDAVVDFNTEIGCSPKQNNNCNKLSHKCAKCEHVWSQKINCDCDSNEMSEESLCTLKTNQENVFSLKGTGYLSMKEVSIKQATSENIKFSIRLNTKTTSQSIVLAYFQIFTNESKMIDKSEQFYLNYKSNKIQLIKNETLILELSFNLNDGYWHKIKLNILNLLNAKIQFKLSVDDVFKTTGSNTLTLSNENKFLKTYIGGSNDNKAYDASSLTGCLKEIDQDFILLRESIDMVKGCTAINQPRTFLSSNNVCLKSICYNNGNCSLTNEQAINCSCPFGYKGKYCQFITKTNNNRNSIKFNSINKCPAKWWGMSDGICGPCNCDETRNFSPDCNKTNGQCECKPKFYKKLNPISKEEQCVPCDCYLEGSASLQCESYTGQCACLPGAGITGRRCDQCVSPYAEMTSKGNECRQLSSSECPRAFKFNVWWPRTPFNQFTNASCPKGSIGMAYRFCTDANGWSPVVDLRDCKSLKIIDSQLAKWSKILSSTSNSSQLNSYQALQLAEDLNRITHEADLDDDLNELFYEVTNYESYEYDSFSLMSTSFNSLYANDLIVIKNLTKHIIQYEIDNAPSFLYIQDKHFLSNIFSTLNRILSKKYEKKLKQLLFSSKSTSFQNDSFLEEMKHESDTIRFHLTDLVIVLDKYLQSIVQQEQQYNQYNVLNNDKFEINLNQFKLYMNTVKGQAFAHSSMTNIKFKLVSTNQISSSSSQKINFITMNTLPSSMPSSLLLQTTTTKYAHNYRLVSNLLMINLQQQNLVNNNNNKSASSVYIVVDFLITNLFETTYDYASNKINYRNLKASDANYLCVYLNEASLSWSTKGAKLISYDYETNTVKCSYDHLSIFGVITPVNGFASGSLSGAVGSGSQPVNFSLQAYILMPLVMFIHLISIVLLISLRKFSSPLTQIYLNLCISVLAMQMLFFFGINSNGSQILCKFIAIAHHFFHLCVYLWMFLILLHLYRMLTELRDINKTDLQLPVFYYAIALGIPALVVCLTLSIKQEIYTNYSFLTILYNGNTAAALNSSYFSSSLYCWLCTNSFYDIFYVLLMPISIITLFLFVLAFLCYTESKRTNFLYLKQSDVPLVTQSLFYCLVLLPIQFLLTFFSLMTIYTSGSYGSLQEFTIYQYLYLGFSFLYALLIILCLIILNKAVRLQLKKSWMSLFSAMSNNNNESLDTSKLKLYNRSPNTNDPVPPPSSIMINHPYILDYRDYQNHKQQLQQNCNSISTTTTSGTLDDIDYQGNYLSNGYLSNLANTTNTESTANCSEFTSTTTHFIDFNRPLNQLTNSQINESDVVDVGKILKSRIMTSSSTSSQNNNNNNNNEAILPTEFTCNQQQSSHASIKKSTGPSLSLFWPTAVAECDTSFLDGSAMYSPAKFPYAKNNINNNIVNVPDILTSSSVIKQQQQQQNATINRNIMKKNNSYNSNSSTSGSGTNSNNFSNSTSSLILNSNSTEQTIVPKIENYAKLTPTKLVAILTHTGSPTTTDNESGNETRV